jgi:hypothetical protein
MTVSTDTLTAQIDDLIDGLYREKRTFSKVDLDPIAGLIETARSQYDRVALEVLETRLTSLAESLPYGEYGGLVAGLAMSAGAALRSCPPELNHEQYQVLAMLVHFQSATADALYRHLNHLPNAGELLDQLVVLRLVARDGHVLVPDGAAKAALIRHAAELEAHRIEYGPPPSG